MNLAPIADASLAIKIHLATVIPAFVIGTWLIFFSTKGARWHRGLGGLYLALMLVTAITTFFIRSINPGHLSPIHLFIPLTLFGVFAALWNGRRGNISGHRAAMLGLYVGGLLIAGGFTLLPGRLLHHVFFD
ncbi:MAG TPA: DUF2306 domain-containing protein [Stellaceae bacterium]|jgi:uncharacterized membrane protein|nr:DUF2306 domain-containing protein [Stellaceae bacterium]